MLIYAVSSLGGGYQLDFIFGGDIEYSNKITYSIKDFLVSPGSEFKLTYNSELLKSILACNKKAESSKLYINSQGIIKMAFNHESNLSSTYYVVSKSQ